jgi:hypothetical protein
MHGLTPPRARTDPAALDPAALHLTIFGHRPQLAIEFSPVELVWLEILVGFYPVDSFAQFVEITNGVAMLVDRNG